MNNFSLLFNTETVSVRRLVYDRWLWHAEGVANWDMCQVEMHSVVVAQTFLLDLSKSTDNDTTISFLLKDKSSTYTSEYSCQA